VVFGELLGRGEEVGDFGNGELVGRMLGSTITAMKLPSPSTAQPRKLKPKPRLATVANTKARAKVNAGSGLATRGTD